MGGLITCLDDCLRTFILYVSSVSRSITMYKIDHKTSNLDNLLPALRLAQQLNKLGDSQKGKDVKSLT